jgi:hypothetical protein
MQLVEADAEVLSNREHDLGQKRCPIGIEEPVQGSSDAIIVEPHHFLCRESEGAGGELMHELPLAVDRFALDNERAQQHAECRGVRHRAAPIARGDVCLEQRRKPQAFEKVVDEG